MYTYTAFGLTIMSEFPLPELVRAAAAEPDVFIRLGQVPDTIDNAIVNKHNRLIGPDEFRLDNPGIAKFFVQNGDSIILEPYEGALAAEIRLYLLGSCMGAILFQSGILPLHGSCLQVNGQGVLLTGKSGAGKSTIAAALLRHGCKLVTDDVAAVTWATDGHPVIQASYPSQKLWEDALLRMDQPGLATPLNRVSNQLNKFAVANAASFCHRPVTLRTIFEIIPEANAQLRFTEVTSTDKLDVIIKNTYRRFWVKGFDCQAWHFRSCANIAGHVAVYRIVRPEGCQLEQEIAQRIVGRIFL